MNLSNLFAADKALFEAKMVFEDLGNLKAIQPEFLKPFLGWGRNPKLDSKSIGQNSTIETYDVTKFQAASALIDGADVEGIVLIVDGKQVLSMAKGKDYKSNPEGKISLDAEFLQKVSPTLFAKFDKRYYMGKKGIASTGTIQYGSAKTVVNGVIKAVLNPAGELHSSFQIMVIRKDMKRVAVSAQRKKAQYNVQPASGDELHKGKWASDTKRALWSRLEKFKASKAKQFSTPEEFMAACIKDGFLDKVNIDGFVYAMREDNLRLSDIVKPSSWHKSNAIAYQLDSHHSAKLDELKKQLWDLHKEADTNPEVKAKVDILKDKFPPRDIKIIMGMQGGTIVPQSVEVSNKEFW